MLIKFEKKYIPNYLTFLRLAFVPVIFIFIIYEQYLLASIMYVIASFTDVLDGFIARKYNLITDLGKLMDPLADKLTQISTISALIIKKIIPFWILVIITIKELIMIIVASILYKRKIVTVHSKWYGKAATVLLFVAIILSLLSEYLPILSVPSLYTYYTAIVVTIFAAIMYAKNIICKDFVEE